MNKIYINTNILKNISITILIFLILSLIIYGVNLHFTSKNKMILNSLYYNEYCIIKNKNYINSDKTFLIQRLEDTTQYTEISKNNISLYSENKYWDSLYYSKNINDTIYIKYIRKNRFFKILKLK